MISEQKPVIWTESVVVFLWRDLNITVTWFDFFRYFPSGHQNGGGKLSAVFVGLSDLHRIVSEEIVDGDRKSVLILGNLPH